MADILSKLQAPPGANRPKLRVGRGIGSGHGKTCGRGQKGQRSRSGSGGKRQFEGGQTTLQRRLPKRGFFNRFRSVVAIVNVGDLERFDTGTAVDEALLRQTRLVRGKCDKIKVLGEGELTKSLTVTVHTFSSSAIDKIEKAGGKVVPLIPPKTEASGEASA
ncbi:MAG: 50S ribosomal protein L15 [Sorangium cellulosum]|nr:MAG: 50S ribosomal protein L15 [Sorangium cellulosum]